MLCACCPHRVHEVSRQGSVSIVRQGPCADVVHGDRASLCQRRVVFALGRTGQRCDRRKPVSVCGGRRYQQGGGGSKVPTGGGLVVDGPLKWGVLLGMLLLLVAGCVPIGGGQPKAS